MLYSEQSLCPAQVLHEQKGWDHQQGDMHMIAAGLGCKKALVGTEWANYHLGCTDKLMDSSESKQVFAVCWLRMLTTASLLMSGHD